MYKSRWIAKIILIIFIKLTLDDNICQYQSKNLYIYIANIIKYALFSIGQLSEKNTEYENMRIQRF